MKNRFLSGLLVGLLVCALPAQGAAACNGCVTDREDISLSIARNRGASPEIYLRYEAPSMFGALRPVVGFSASGAAEKWAGAGLMLTWKSAQNPFFVQGSVMPGLYDKGRGADLGGSFQIRSSLEIGYELPSRLRIGIGVDHRSNADTFAFNPGKDGVHLRVTYPLR